jgi:hypothetical protein
MSKLQGWTVEQCDRKEVRGFIEMWHYSQSINGVMSSYCFKLLDDNGLMVGAALFGSMGMANTWKRYVSKPEQIIELRRLCLIDDTPKNAESFMIGKCMRWLRKNTDITHIISYADMTHNHTGIIYQATNFKKVGLTAPGRMIELNGRLWHDKTIRTKYNGQLKPFAQRIKDSLDAGDAKYVKTQSKVIYLYEFGKGKNGNALV